MNFFNYPRLNNIYKITYGTEIKQNVFGQIDNPSLQHDQKSKVNAWQTNISEKQNSTRTLAVLLFV